jgi:hypothetical protein
VGKAVFSFGRNPLASRWLASVATLEMDSQGNQTALDPGLDTTAVNRLHGRFVRPWFLREGRDAEPLSGMRKSAQEGTLSYCVYHSKKIVKQIHWRYKDRRLGLGKSANALLKQRHI